MNTPFFLHKKKERAKSGVFFYTIFVQFYCVFYRYGKEKGRKK